jgi:hypothetical protein
VTVAVQALAGGPVRGTCAGRLTAGQKMPRRRANLPQMGDKDARAPIVVGRPAGGNHTRQGSGSRSGLVFVVSPLTRVVGLRPGRPTMGTLKAELCCADALGDIVGADRRSARPGALTVHACPAGSPTGRKFLSWTLTTATMATPTRTRATMATPTRKSASRPHPHTGSPHPTQGGRPCSSLSGIGPGQRGYSRVVDNWIRERTVGSVTA